MKLLVGTRSPGKTREIRELFAGLPFEISFPADRLLQPLPEMSIRGQAIRAESEPALPLAGVAQADLPPAFAAP